MASMKNLIKGYVLKNQTNFIKYIIIIIKLKSNKIKEKCFSFVICYSLFLSKFYMLFI